MTNGAAVQLTMSGGQDKFLNFEASSGFFDSQHITYENFAVESVAVETAGAPDFKKTTRFKFTGVAELITGGYIETIISGIRAPNAVQQGPTVVYSVAWCHMVGIYLYKKIEFTINNSVVDTHYPQYMDMYSRLITTKDKIAGFNDIIGEMNFTTKLANHHELAHFQLDPDAPQIPSTPDVAPAEKAGFKVMLPLSFWWCLDYSQALPIGLLLFSDIYINVEYEDVLNLYTVYEYDWVGNPLAVDLTTYRPTTLKAVTAPTIINAQLYLDFVFINEYSRDRLANKQLFYVIKQVKSPGTHVLRNKSENFRFPASMPVTSIMFGIQEDAAIAPDYKRYSNWDRFKGNHYDYGAVGVPVTNSWKFDELPDAPFQDATLKILTNDRFSTRDWMYWTRWTTRANTCIPETRGIGIYHFALYPEQHLASGAINLSHSDNNYVLINMNNKVGKNYTSSSKLARETNCGIGSTGVTGQLYFYYIHHNYVYLDGGYLTVLYAA